MSSSTTAVRTKFSSLESASPKSNLGARPARPLIWRMSCSTASTCWRSLSAKVLAMLRAAGELKGTSSSART